MAGPGADDEVIVPRHRSPGRACSGSGNLTDVLAFHDRPAKRRWGSVLGVQPDGLEVFTPTGQAFRFPAWSIDRVLMPLIVRRGIYRGVRENHPVG